MAPVDEILSYASLMNCVLTEEQLALALKYYIPRRVGEYSTISDEQLTWIIGGEERVVNVNGKNRKKIECKICQKELTNDKGVFLKHCVKVHKTRDELTIKHVLFLIGFDR